MKSSLIVSCCLFSGSLVLGACVDTAPTDDVDHDDDVTNPARLSANGITPAQMWSVALTPATLDATVASTLASTADGRAVGAYFVGCALATGHNVSTTYTNSFGQQTNLTFSGAIGLADSWTSSALTTAQQELVSSCMLARVNETGVSVTISLRGNSSGLAVTGSEAANDTLQEGAFFGNVFAAKGSGWFAGSCKGSGTAPSNRQCAQQAALPALGKCGMTWAGNCADICTWDSTNGYFTGCSANSTSYGAPITSYLVP